MKTIMTSKSGNYAIVELDKNNGFTLCRYGVIDTFFEKEPKLANIVCGMNSIADAVRCVEELE